MAFMKADRQYALITDASTGTADTPGGLGAILTQVDKEGNFHAISFASRQLKDHEMNYSPFLLEASAAVWGMNFFNEYLKGKRFILYTDHKPLEKLGHLQRKTLNRLQTALLCDSIQKGIQHAGGLPLQTARSQGQHRQHLSFQPFPSGSL
jgi:hypothetical protein